MTLWRSISSRGKGVGASSTRRSPQHGRLARVRVGLAAVVLPVLVHEAQKRVAVPVADVRTRRTDGRPRRTRVLPRLHIGRCEEHERERERREDRHEALHRSRTHGRVTPCTKKSACPSPSQGPRVPSNGAVERRPPPDATRKLGLGGNDDRPFGFTLYMGTSIIFRVNLLPAGRTGFSDVTRVQSKIAHRSSPRAGGFAKIDEYSMQIIKP